MFIFGEFILKCHRFIFTVAVQEAETDSDFLFATTEHNICKEE